MTPNASAACWRLYQKIFDKTDGNTAETIIPPRNKRLREPFLGEQPPRGRVGFLPGPSISRADHGLSGNSSSLKQDVGLEKTNPTSPSRLQTSRPETPRGLTLGDGASLSWWLHKLYEHDPPSTWRRAEISPYVNPKSVSSLVRSVVLVGGLHAAA